MSAYHHKALLIDSTDGVCRYQYFPACYDHPDTSGVFAFHTATCNVDVELPTDHQHDQHAVGGLTHKITKMIRNGEPAPETILFVG